MVSKNNSAAAPDYKLFDQCGDSPIDMLDRVRIHTLMAETLLDRAHKLIEGGVMLDREDACNVSSLVLEANLIVSKLCHDAYRAVDVLTDAELAGGDSK